MSALPHIRTITMHLGASASQSWVATVEGNPEPYKIKFASSQVYARQPEKAEEACADTVRYFASSGLDAAGADSVELALVLFTTFSPPRA